MLELENFPD